MNIKLIKRMLVVYALCISQFAMGQDTTSRTPRFSPDQKAEKLTAHLKQQLSLSDDQAEKVKTVYTEHIQKIQSGSAKRKEAHQELESKLSQILSKDQLDKFKSLESERREQMRNRRSQKDQSSPPGQGTNQDNTQPDGQK